MIYIVLFLEFFKVGLFTIGGGLASLPFLYELAEKYTWINNSMIADMIAISQSTPGPIGINMATYAGFKAGGILGGISNSDQIVFKTYFKPTPSISFTQDTIDDQNNEIQLTIKGRHDPCIGVRAVVVVEAMASAVILDFLLRRRCDRI